MAVLATYVNATQFTIEGEYDHEFPIGRRLLLFQGVAGSVKTTVADATYDAGSDLTSVTTKHAVVLSTLVSVKRGPSDPTSVGGHGHTSDDDGGFMPSSQLSSYDVDDIIGGFESASSVLTMDTGAVLGYIQKLERNVRELRDDVESLNILLG